MSTRQDLEVKLNINLLDIELHLQVSLRKRTGQQQILWDTLLPNLFLVPRWIWHGQLRWQAPFTGQDVGNLWCHQGQQGGVVDLSSLGAVSRAEQHLLGRCPRHCLPGDGSVELSPHRWFTGKDFAQHSHGVVPSLSTCRAGTGWCQHGASLSKCLLDERDGMTVGFSENNYGCAAGKIFH